jgi:hypothetical protein
MTWTLCPASTALFPRSGVRVSRSGSIGIVDDIIVLVLDERAVEIAKRRLAQEKP